ncbi:MAG: oligoribonuclease [bacterium]|nr:oligoribonuclease [bacterium]
MLVWIDLEMTGLDADRDRVLEIATVITDDDLNPLNEGLRLVISQPPEVLSLMGEVVSKMHHESGLTDDVRRSTLSLAEAQQQTLDFIRQYISEPGKVPLCGNSIGMDRRFLNRWLPEIENLLHYHVVDVSSLQELALRWYPEAAKKRPKKRKGHRALDDIMESIEELRYWRRSVFASAPTST